MNAGQAIALRKYLEAIAAFEKAEEAITVAVAAENAARLAYQEKWRELRHTHQMPAGTYVYGTQALTIPSSGDYPRPTRIMGEILLGL